MDKINASINQQNQSSFQFQDTELPDIKVKLISSWLQLKEFKSSNNTDDDIDDDEIFQSIQDYSGPAPGPCPAIVDRTTTKDAEHHHQHKCIRCPKSFKTLQELCIHNNTHCWILLQQIPAVELDIIVKEEPIPEVESNEDPSPWNFDTLAPPNENDGYDYYLASLDPLPQPLEAIKTEANEEVEENSLDVWLPEAESAEASDASPSDSENDEETDTEFPCPNCKKVFKLKSSMIRHSRKYHAGTGDKPHMCSTCGKTFRTKSDLKDHDNRVHIQTKTLKCSYCTKLFSQRKNLKVHELSHTKVKPFKCKECNKGFGLEYLLKQHSSIHTGEKAFKCTDLDCGREFRLASDFRRHVARIHSTEKSHICKTCKKAFSAKWDLTRHQKQHW